MFHATAQRRNEAKKDATKIFAYSFASLRRCVKYSSSEVRIFGECQAEIAIVQVDHQVVCDELFESCVEPRSVVELRGDLFTTASVGAVLVEIRVEIGIR